MAAEGSSASASWVRPLNPGEEVNEVGQAKHRTQITCYRLGLCSRDCLEGSTLEKALSALYRKVPHLRFCIREKDGKLWFRRLDQQRVLCKVLDETADVSEVIEEEVTTSFDSLNGPLWRAVFFPMPDTSTHLIEDLTSDYPHQYHLLLTFHHAITDGYTTVKVCHLFLQLLNDIIEGNSIDEDDQLGEFNDGAETMRLIMERKEQLDRDPKRKEMIVNAVNKISEYRPLMVEAFPVPEDEMKNKTCHLTRQYTQEQTKKLIAFFKEEGITLNSGFIALANISLVEMFKKRGFNQRMFEICSYNAVNFRRYWKNNTSGDLGCHFGPLSLITETPANSYQHFLEYAHDIQTNMYDYIENNRTFDECLFLDVKRGSGAKDMDEFFSNPPQWPQFFHSTTNMGDLAGSLPGTGQHVQISWLSRHNSFHRYNSTFINSLQTFRGRLLLGIEYNARNITAAVAQEYADSIHSLILDIVRQM